MFLRPINTTQLQLVAKLIGVCSCGGNQLIDHLNKVGGNQVKIRQAVDSCVAISIILFNKKQQSHEKCIYALLKRQNHGDIVCMCVFLLHHIPLLFVGVLSCTCISVLWSD